MNLAKFPRRRYTEGKTPLVLLSRLTQVLDGPNIYMKRDDLLGLTGGGNKTRKLEFLMADALEKGADTIITCGAVQSNHCRLTIAASIREGLKCRLVLEERVKGTYDPKANGNNFLFQLLGVEQTRVAPGGSNMLEEMEKVAEEVRAEGGVPYIIPGGGSNEIGSLGYVACAEEILGQAFEMGLDIDCTVTTSGSTGTHAGLVVGFSGCNSNIPVIGIGINRKKAPQEEAVYDLVKKTAPRVGITNAIPRSSVVVHDDYIGEGYSIPTEAMVDAVIMLARTEGILMDPVYTGKALSGFIDLIKKGVFKKGQNVVFVHTGGSPALYAYAPVFWEKIELK